MTTDRHRVATLAGETDFEGFRMQTRTLVAQGAEPATVSWQLATRMHGELFAAEPVPAWSPHEAATSPALKIPAALAPVIEHAILYRAPDRFDRLYRFIWRLVHERALRHDPLDADRQAVEAMARAVRRDMHKMTAFVRFRPLPHGDGEAPEHVAWFEPGHHIVEATAPFFARRFAQMRWAILTPDRCVRWDGQALAFEDGADRASAPPADASEALWLTYYASILNPARLKLSMMQKEMPRRYWKNLPEAVLIQPLAAAAAARSGQMVEQAPGPGARRPAASAALALSARPVPVHAPGSLDELRAATERCRACPIGAHATQAVHGEGPLQARLMLVGEQPGDREDLAGRPFVGPAGQLLDRALRQLGWTRDRLFLTNAVRHFKFTLSGQRRIHKTPAQREAAACLEWLEREIDLVAPGAILALGATAARAVLGRPVEVMAERGRWQQRADGRRVLVTLHPAALLRMAPQERPVAFERWLDDLRQAAPSLQPA